MITYITTTRNRPIYLLSCAYSVLAQTIRPEWVIVIDDDYYKYKKVIEIIKKYIPNVFVYCEGLIGRNKALIKAHELITTTHVAWLDDDDLLSSQATVNLISNLQYELVYTDFYVIGNGNKIVVSGRNKVPYSYKNMLKFNCVFHLTMYSMKLYKKCGGINPTYNSSIDYEFRLRQLDYTDPIKINKSLYYYREHKNRITNNLRLKQQENFKRATKEAKERRGLL